MRAESFPATDRGHARRTVDGYVAFFPTEVPRQLELSPTTVKVLDEATGAVHRLGGVGRPDPELTSAHRSAPAPSGRHSVTRTSAVGRARSAYLRVQRTGDSLLTAAGVIVAKDLALLSDGRGSADVSRGGLDAIAMVP
jgi:hypothetical protein